MKKNLRGETIYQIMVDRFYNGNKNTNYNDGIHRYQEDTEDDFYYFHGGDWQGVIKKLTYIKKMGYTAILISPIGEPQLWILDEENNSQTPVGYHGYNTYDFSVANSFFGDKDPKKSKKILRKLIRVCHRNGLKVILDIVPNHIGSFVYGIKEEARYLTEEEYRQICPDMKEGTQIVPAAPFNNVNWYHNKGGADFSQWHDDTIENNTWLEDHDLFGLDDIDYHNKEAKDEVIKIYKNWFKYTKADAARIDAAKHMNPSDIEDLVKEINVPAFVEVFDYSVKFITNWLSDEAQIGTYDFPLLFAIQKNFGEGTSFRNGVCLRDVFEKDYLYGENVNDLVTIIDGHDENRFLTLASNNVLKLQNALIFIFTVRGIPCVLYGTEQNKGNANKKFLMDPHNWNRWSMIKRDFEGNVIEDYFRKDTDTYKLIGTLNKIRKKYPALNNGEQIELYCTDHLYVFERKYTNEKNKTEEIVCAFNNSYKTQENIVPLRAETSFVPGQKLVNIFDSKDVIEVTEEKTLNIEVSPNSSKIYVLKTLNMREAKFEEANKCVVTFNAMNVKTILGEKVYVCGNIDELGNWDDSKAFGPLEPEDYPNWYNSILLDKGQIFEYKFIKKHESFDGKYKHVVWENGENRKGHILGDTTYSIKPRF